MSTVDVATLKAHAEELIAKAIAGEATVIEQNGRRAVLLPCEGDVPDFELDGDTDRLLRERLQAPGRQPTAADWAALRRDVQGAPGVGVVIDAVGRDLPEHGPGLAQVSAGPQGHLSPCYQARSAGDKLSPPRKAERDAALAVTGKAGRTNVPVRPGQSNPPWGSMFGPGPGLE